MILIRKTGSTTMMSLSSVSWRKTTKRESSRRASHTPRISGSSLQCVDRTTRVRNQRLRHHARSSRPPSGPKARLATPTIRCSLGGPLLFLWRNVGNIYNNFNIEPDILRYCVMLLFKLMATDIFLRSHSNSLPHGLPS